VGGQLYTGRKNAQSILVSKSQLKRRLARSGWCWREANESDFWRDGDQVVDYFNWLWVGQWCVHVSTRWISLGFQLNIDECQLYFSVSHGVRRWVSERRLPLSCLIRHDSSQTVPRQRTEIPLPCHCAPS
jgi:hypothetical protein